MADPTLAHYGSRRGAACGATGDTWFSDPALFLEVRPELRCEACLTRAQAALSGGPTLAEMVERLRTCADVAPLPVVADALTEIDRRLTALESAAHQHAPPENMGADVLRDALRLKTALDSCTWPITVDELARAVGLTPSRVTEVVIRSGLRHRWLVGWGPSTEGRAVTVHVGQGVTPIAGGLAYLGALPGVACVSPAGPVKVVRLDSTPAHLPTCGTAFRGCDPACPKDRAERGI